MDRRLPEQADSPPFVHNVYVVAQRKDAKPLGVGPYLPPEEPFPWPQTPPVPV